MVVHNLTKTLNMPEGNRLYNLTPLSWSQDAPTSQYPFCLLSHGSPFSCLFMASFSLLTPTPPCLPVSSQSLLLSSSFPTAPNPLPLMLVCSVPSYLYSSYTIPIPTHSLFCETLICQCNLLPLFSFCSIRLLWWCPVKFPGWVCVTMKTGHKIIYSILSGDSPSF